MAPRGRGAAVALIDRDEEGLRGTAGALPDGARSGIFAVDVADEAAVEACVADVLARYGRIDVLCNNAGILGGSTAIATEQDLGEWQRVMAVNLFGAVNFTKYASRPMQAAGRSAIVNTASVAGIRSGAGETPTAPPRRG